jgi:hypothetical protein
MTSNESILKARIRMWIIFFIVCLILSGITAFPIESQLRLLVPCIHVLPETLQLWIQTIYIAVANTNKQYPYLAYGTDWLAFAHIVIAVAFIGPLKDPLRNIWVIQFGMIACMMVVPLALIAGEIREIPMFWRMIDCSFGIIGLIPLYICYQAIRKLEQFLKTNLIR